MNSRMGIKKIVYCVLLAAVFFIVSKYSTYASEDTIPEGAEIIDVSSELMEK